jgi:hypothetical protein
VLLGDRGSVLAVVSAFLDDVSVLAAVVSALRAYVDALLGDGWSLLAVVSALRDVVPAVGHDVSSIREDSEAPGGDLASLVAVVWASRGDVSLDRGDVYPTRGARRRLMEVVSASRGNTGLLRADRGSHLAVVHAFRADGSSMQEGEKEAFRLRRPAAMSPIPTITAATPPVPPVPVARLTAHAIWSAVESTIPPCPCTTVVGEKLSNEAPTVSLADGLYVYSNRSLGPEEA